jgi:hypothetical protein
MASRPRRRIALVGAGIALLLAAGTLRVVGLPQLSRLPEGFTGTQQSVGTYTGLNPAALKGGRGPVTVERAPVTVERTLTSAAVDGDTTVVTLTSGLRGRGFALPKQTFRYAVDRSTFQAVTPPAGSPGVARAEGVVVALPMHPEPGGDYRLWDPFTARSHPLTYGGDDVVAGRRVLVFTTTAKGDVADPKAVGLPASLTRGQAEALAPTLGSALPAGLRARLPRLLELLPARVPMAFRASTTTTLYVDATLGIPVQATVKQTVSIRMAGLPGMNATVSTLQLTTKKASVTRTGALLKDAATRLFLIGTVLPAALGLLGLLLLGLGLTAVLRSRRDPWIWLQPVRRRARRKAQAEMLAYQAGWGAGVVTGTGLAVATKAGEVVSHVVDEVKAEIRGDDVAEVIGEQLGRVDGAPEPAAEQPDRRPAPDEPIGSDDVVWAGPAHLPEEAAVPLPTRHTVNG